MDQSMTEQTRAVAVRPSQEVLIPETGNMEALAGHLLGSGLFPNVKNTAGAITIIEYGRELGIPPVCALQTMAIIRGKLTMEAKAMLAVAQNRAGVSWKIMTMSDTECAITFMRPGFENQVTTFTYAEAKAAGLTDKDNWKAYRQDMLFARCASRGVRRIAPDAVLGLYSTEEMKDVEYIEKCGIRVPSDSEVLAKKPPEPEPPKEEAADPFASDKDIPVYMGEEVVDEPFDEPYNPEFDEPGELGEDSGVNVSISVIHKALRDKGVDERKFKEWLVKQGEKMNRKFVGFHGKTLRYHKGKPEDVKYLESVIVRAIGTYTKEAGQ